MVQMTAQYTSEREQFNVKIATFQAVGHRVANCYMDAKCLKLVTLQAIDRLAAVLMPAQKFTRQKCGWAMRTPHQLRHATFARRHGRRSRLPTVAFCTVGETK
jgi:alkylation response protein AidB-like acyl-CoA dehydrogenase